MLRLVASIAAGIPVSLQDALTRLDSTNIELLTAAIRHTAGQPPSIASFTID